MAGGDDFEYAKSVNEQAINSSNVAMRSLLLINGGSDVALLAFVGSISSSDSVDFSKVIFALSEPLLLFGWGVALSVIAMMFAYFTNYSTVGHTFAEAGSTEEKVYAFVKGACHLITVVTAFASLSLFLWGIYEVREAVVLIAR